MKKCAVCYTEREHSESCVYVDVCKTCGNFTVHFWSDISLYSRTKAYLCAYKIFICKELTKRQKIKIALQATKEHVQHNFFPEPQERISKRDYCSLRG